MAGLPLVGDEFAGYRVRAVLGRGGMSVVYQAENLRLSSVIALKVLAPELASDDVFRARFLEESRIAASLNHPNVIPIYDMGSQDDLLYIAMRYVSGTDMRQMIKKRGRILPATALFLIGQAARALDAAHRKGLVHRDVKPGNLLIERGSDDADPDHVYLADFGITKHAMSRSGLTSTGPVPGHDQLRRPGADPRHVGARPGRPVLAGLRAVRVPDRAGPVREGPGRGDHLGARRGDAHHAHGPAPGTAAGNRPGVRPGAGQAAGRALRELPRVRRGRPDGAGPLRVGDRGVGRLRRAGLRAADRCPAWQPGRDAAGPVLLEHHDQPGAHARARPCDPVPRPASPPRPRPPRMASLVTGRRPARAGPVPVIPAGPSPPTAASTASRARGSLVRPPPRRRRRRADRGSRSGTAGRAGSPCWPPWSWSSRARAPGSA